MNSKELKNILLVTTELRPGGAEKCLTRIACELDRSKFRVGVVSIASRPRQSESRLVRELENNEILVKFLDCDSKLSIWTAIRKLRNVVQEFQAEIVQSFLIHANVVAGMALRRIPNVDFYSGIRVADPSWFRHQLEKWATARAKKIICVSESVREFAAKEMGFPESKLISIPNSVEPLIVNNEIDLEPEGIKKPFVVFVGRLERQKGLVEFLKNFAVAENTLPPFEIVFVGQGSELDELKSITQKLRRNVHFVGWKENVIDYISQSAIKILPSLWEGMPNALLETMSIGKPFVAFGVDGINELCPKDSIQLVRPGEYDSFFETMTQLLTDKELARKTGEQNAKFVRDNFSTKKMIAKYEAVYLGSATNPG